MLLYGRHEYQNPHFVIFFLHEMKCIFVLRTVYNANSNDVSKELIDSM